MIKSLALAILLIPSLLFGGQGMGPGPGVKSYSAAASCSGTPSYEQAAIDDYWAYLSTSNAGARYIGSTGYTVCSISIHPEIITGDIAGKTYSLRVYALSGANLGAMLGSKTFNGSALSANSWYNVVFDSSFSTGTSGFAVVVVPLESFDASNFFRFSASLSAGDGNWSTDKWDSGGVNTSTVSSDMALRIYQ